MSQIDPGSNRVVNQLEVGNASRGIAAGFGALWVTSANDGAVRRIDLDRPADARRIAMGANPTAIAAGDDAIWVASEEAGTVTRLEPRTGDVTGAIRVGNGPSAIAVGAGAVWVVNRLDGTVSRIDSGKNAVTSTVHVGADPTGVAVGEGGVWIAGGASGTMTLIDPDALTVRERFDIENSASAVAIADGKVWTAAVAPPASHRGGTLRVISPGSESDPVEIDWLDQSGYDSQTSRLISLAYDGLVGYRRVAGVAGATLAGALATDVPRPSPDRRTYVFTLRPGLRYSDGTAVRPEDFRASVERFLQVAGDNPAFPRLFAGIVGARRCEEESGRCDLSAGIETDGPARTITVHLTRPDADFLNKLTMQFAYVVPATTPRRRTGDDVLPGTGPYRFASWDARRGGRLVRNPHFHAWSPQARPDGFADRIEVDTKPRQGVRGQVADVERGTADVVALAGPFGTDVSPDRFAALRVRFPGQLHSYPESVLNFMFLNVRRPPFDDVEARRALNFATDRSRIVELEGGPAVGQPACQILPSTVPGHEPYCPYTARAGRERGWSAPDMERARALVANSGTAGERVVVSVPPFRRGVGRYFTVLLDRLGYRASLRVLPDAEYWPGIIQNPPASRVQIAFLGWGADYPSASSFIEPNFGCPDNLSHFCDPWVTSQIAQALASEGAAAAGRWAAIDRRVTDLAPAVPLTNRRSVDLVSTRVGNVQHHLQGGTLLDQMWVR